VHDRRWFVGKKKSVCGSSWCCCRSSFSLTSSCRGTGGYGACKPRREGSRSPSSKSAEYGWWPSTEEASVPVACADGGRIGPHSVTDGEATSESRRWRGSSQDPKQHSSRGLCTLYPPRQKESCWFSGPASKRLAPEMRARSGTAEWNLIEAPPKRRIVYACRCPQTMTLSTPSSRYLGHPTVVLQLTSDSVGMCGPSTLVLTWSLLVTRSAAFSTARWTPRLIFCRWTTLTRELPFEKTMPADIAPTPAPVFMNLDSIPLSILSIDRALVSHQSPIFQSLPFVVSKAYGILHTQVPSRRRTLAMLRGGRRNRATFGGLLEENRSCRREWYIGCTSRSLHVLCFPKLPR